jgi:hypothetical protein
MFFYMRPNTQSNANMSDHLNLNFYLSWLNSAGTEHAVNQQDLQTPSEAKKTMLNLQQCQIARQIPIYLIAFLKPKIGISIILIAVT